MKHHTQHANRSQAITLVETMVALMATSLILAALLIGSTALQRSFSATDDFSASVNTQIRILDYVARDVRRAITATVDQSGVAVTSPTTGNKLTVTVPPYTYASAEPVAPSLNNSAVSYQGTPSTIVYSTSGQSVIRTVDGTPTTIATGTTNLQLILEDFGTSIKATVSFAPTFQRTVSTAARQGTTMSVTAVLRNARQ